MFSVRQSLVGDDRRIVFALLAFLCVVSGCHLVYVLASRMVPSADEAHYMSGAYSIAQGIRSGSLEQAWTGYVTALGFKSPLICLPAAFSMLVFGDDYTACLLAQIAILFGLGLAAYSLFRNGLTPGRAAVAACLLVTMPLSTGLTHRFYTENLLLLIMTVYLDLLIRHGWSGFRPSALLGVALGLGALAKLTFLPLLLLPSAGMLMVTVGRVVRQPHRGREFGLLTARVAVCLAVGFLIAWSWYGRNWEATYLHSQRSYSSHACAYPGWGSILANLSSGPHFFTVPLALCGLATLLRPATWRAMPAPERHTWIALLLLALVSCAMTTESINKAVRFSQPWLLLLAPLVTRPPLFLLPSRRAARAGGMLVVMLSFVLFLHNSFGLLPFKPVRSGDLRILDSRFFLNVPGWFEDNHPLDTRDFRKVEEAAEFIAGDARTHFGPQSRPTVRLTVAGLLLGHDYFSFLAFRRGDPVNYLWWHGAETTGPAAPQYILHARGFGGFYPGTHFFDFYPAIESEVAAGILDYELIREIAGPEQSGVLIFRKKEPLPPADPT